MKRFLKSLIGRLALPVAIAAALAGCSALDVKPQAVDKVNAMKKGPEAAPYRSITGFSAGLRCMDNLMIEHGVRDVSMLVEDILDQTKKVNAGTRDMLISAVSDMTRRSRAIRLIAFGKDATNVISFLQSAQRQGAYEVIPQFDIKGSVSQWDESVIRNQKDLGAGFQPFLNLGASKDATASILGLDLSVLTTDDMSILPGVTSRNSVVIFKEGQGTDGDAAYHKFGLSFSMSLNKSEGQSQALRALVELAVIELMGKLTKTPYWTCLGADPKANEEIRLEVADWYYAMAANSGEIIAYFQNQLRRRGYYDGPIDGRFNPAIDEALANYRAAVGLSREAVIDEALFTTYLHADHSKTPVPAKPAVAVATQPAAAPAPIANAAPSTAPGAAASAPPGAATQVAALPSVAPAQEAPPLRLALTTVSKHTRFARGETINLLVAPSRDSHVYCYLQDENASITRFFPNRFAKDSFVPAGRPLELPGKMRFQLVMNAKGVQETVACFATTRDVLADLPSRVVGGDFEPLPEASIDQIREAFRTATRGTAAQEIFHVQPR